ncbi:MAG TPA: nucleotidyltransferase domain-containing protein [Planctomycetota bacterium]|nr:nucleotidyltransferase domain-containing protein [Planctomycetota bacterium]
MIRIVSEKVPQIRELCGTYGVVELDLFGSAASGGFDPNRSDLDFLVEFGTVEGKNIADQYFGLLEALESLFERRIDLVMSRALRNPHLIRSIEETRERLYASEVA